MLTAEQAAGVRQHFRPCLESERLVQDDAGFFGNRPAMPGGTLAKLLDRGVIDVSNGQSRDGDPPVSIRIYRRPQSLPGLQSPLLTVSNRGLRRHRRQAL